MEMQDWQKPAKSETDFHCVEATRGREFIVRLTTGADPVKALKHFAEEKKIRFGKIHAAFMGGFEPVYYDCWAPDARDMSNKNFEATAVRNNITMLSAIGGMIGIRPDGHGGEESFVAAHFVAGGAWDSNTVCGHLEEGTKVFGVMQVFVTEILDIDVIYPCQLYVDDAAFDKYPENWYKSLKTPEG